MITRSILIAGSMLVMSASAPAQTSQQEVVEKTRDWLQNAHKGDRAGLNAVMDARCLVTTPAGGVYTKERLIPDDPARAVHFLDPLELDGPMVRIYGDTAVLMSRLKPAVADGRSMNGTFVYAKRENGWKLVGLQLSPQK